MKKSLLLYLLIVAVLLNIFTYTYYSKQVSFEQNESKIHDKKLKDSLNLISNQLIDADYFSLEKNQNAQNYFDNENPEKYISYKKLIPLVTNKLMDFNDNPKGNIYTGQEQLGTTKFIINKIKILNHRWIIADFSDSQIWGEVLLKYFVNEDKSVTFEVNQSLLYPKEIIK